jgi:hypothetical protein
MSQNEKRLLELKREEEALLYLIDIHNAQKHLFSMDDKELSEYNDAVLDELNELRIKIREIEDSENL